MIKSTITKVRNIGIEDVLTPYVSLKRKGSSLVGAVPIPFGKDTVLHGLAAERPVPLLRL